jgi:hypothetical protein
MKNKCRRSPKDCRSAKLLIIDNTNEMEEEHGNQWRCYRGYVLGSISDKDRESIDHRYQ